MEVPGDGAEAVAIEEGEDVTVGLHVEDGEPFAGEAEVVLEKDGREVYKQTQVLSGSVTVPTGGEGDYAVLVRSADRSARVAFEMRDVAGTAHVPTNDRSEPQIGDGE